MKNEKKGVLLIIGVFFSFGVMAEQKISSPNGNSVVFMQKKQGNNIDPNAWGKIYFIHGGQKHDLSRGNRYYIKDSSSKMSPSGEYLKLISISGDYLVLDDGSEKYTDRAYCSVIDMKDGCVVSDWDGEACSYDWEKNKDVLSEYPDGHGEKFDFLSLRPRMKFSHDPFSSYSSYDVNNLLRCDAPNESNINEYQSLMDENSESKRIVSVEIVNYLNSLKITLTLSRKSTLHTSPEYDAKSKGYLIYGDTVKVIRSTQDNKWVNIGYINSKGIPLVAWIKQ